jgi:hypothetical protein
MKLAFDGEWHWIDNPPQVANSSRGRFVSRVFREVRVIDRHRRVGLTILRRLDNLPHVRKHTKAGNLCS